MNEQKKIDYVLDGTKKIAMQLNEKFACLGLGELSKIILDGASELDRLAKKVEESNSSGYRAFIHSTSLAAIQILICARLLDSTSKVPEKNTTELENAGASQKKVFVITADFDHETRTPILCAALEQEAKDFIQRCQDYNQNRPNTDYGIFTDESRNDEYLEWAKKEEEWKAGHPDQQCYFCDGNYSITEVQMIVG